MAITLQITADAAVQMLHDDAVDLADLGQGLAVWRASHVEWEAGGWYVDSAATGLRLASGFASRAEALAWEKAHYSPGGPGWNEINTTPEVTTK